MEGPVALGGQADAAAFPGDPDAVFHRLDVGGLLLDGDGSHQPAEQIRYPAQGENILGGQIVNRLTEGHAHEELVEAGLVVHDD